MCSTATAEDPQQALTAVRTLLSETLAQVEDLSHDQCTALLQQLRAIGGKVDALTLAVVGKVDADGTYTLAGHLSARPWVQGIAHQTPGQAARTVRTARVLRSGLLPNPSSPATPGPRRGAGLDGLLRISQHWLETSPPHPDTTARRTSKTRARLVVTLDAASLTAQPGTQGSPGGTLSWAGRITASTAQRLGCSSDTTFVQLNENGEVVEAGSQRRFFTDSQILAMIGRDGHSCPAPYCDRPSAWSDGPHLTPRSQGGPTTVANGALPCEGHHVMLHEGHWTLERLPDGRYRMWHPDGRTLGPEPPRPGHNRPPPEPSSEPPPDDIDDAGP
jgi:hypothetical protein